MKKILIIAAFALLIGGSYYTVNNYNDEKAKDEVTTNLNNNSTTDSLESNNSESNVNSNTNATESTSDTKKEKALDFTLKDLNGKEVSLSNFKGKKVYLNFWATWCPPCKAEMPEIEKLYQETKDTDLVILTVEIGEPSDTVKSFIKDNGYNFNVLLDTEQSVAVEYNISSIPTSYFIDEDGYIVSTVVGAMDLSEIQSHVKELE